MNEQPENKKINTIMYIHKCLYMLNTIMVSCFWGHFIIITGLCTNDLILAFIGFILSVLMIAKINNFPVFHFAISNASIPIILLFGLSFTLHVTNSQITPVQLQSLFICMFIYLMICFLLLLYNFGYMMKYLVYTQIDQDKKEEEIKSGDS